VYGSTANNWFDGSLAKEKDTFEYLHVAFKIQWPLTMLPKASQVEWKLVLREWVIKPNELGKKVEGLGGMKVWSLVKWTTGL
jgi:hypothetical protein